MHCWNPIGIAAVTVIMTVLIIETSDKESALWRECWDDLVSPGSRWVG